MLCRYRMYIYIQTVVYLVNKPTRMPYIDIVYVYIYIYIIVYIVLRK